MLFFGFESTQLLDRTQTFNTSKKKIACCRPDPARTGSLPQGPYQRFFRSGLPHPLSRLCVFQNTSLNKQSRTRLPMEGPRGSFVQFVSVSVRHQRNISGVGWHGIKPIHTPVAEVCSMSSVPNKIFHVLDYVMFLQSTLVPSSLLLPLSLLVLFSSKLSSSPLVHSSSKSLLSPLVLPHSESPSSPLV